MKKVDFYYIRKKIIILKKIKIRCSKNYYTIKIMTISAKNFKAKKINNQTFNLRMFYKTHTKNKFKIKKILINIVRINITLIVQKIQKIQDKQKNSVKISRYYNKMIKTHIMIVIIICFRIMQRIFKMMIKSNLKIQIAPIIYKIILPKLQI